MSLPTRVLLQSHFITGTTSRGCSSSSASSRRALIGWQSWETRRAAEATKISAQATEDSVRLQEVQLTQWVTFQEWKLPRGLITQLELEEMQVSFEVLNPTNYPLTLVAVTLRIGTATQTSLAGHMLAPHVPYTIEFSLPFTVDDGRMYQTSNFIFSLRGTVEFNDIRAQRQKLPFGGLVHCNIARGVSFVQHSAYVISAEEQL
jgi:hypothetical protein